MNDGRHVPITSEQEISMSKLIFTKCTMLGALLLSAGLAGSGCVLDEEVDESEMEKSFTEGEAGEDVAEAEGLATRALRSSVNRGLCLDVSGGRSALGTNVQIWTCNGTKAQTWTYTSKGEMRSAVARNRCLDVSGGRAASGTNVQIWSCNGTNAQKWIPTSQGEWRSAVAPGLCLDISGGRMERGTNVQIWKCNGTAAQKW
jgi:hypothetical protein